MIETNFDNCLDLCNYELLNEMKSWVVPLRTFSSLVTYFNSGHCTKLAVFQFVYSGPCLNKQS